MVKGLRRILPRWLSGYVQGCQSPSQGRVLGHSLIINDNHRGEEDSYEEEKGSPSPQGIFGPIPVMYTGPQTTIVPGPSPQFTPIQPPFIAPSLHYYEPGQPYNQGYIPGGEPHVYPSTLYPASFVPDFRGASGWECEEFIRALRAKAFADDKDGDEQWMLRLMVAHLSGKALRWYSTLPSSVKSSWEDVVDAMLEEYPTKDPPGCYFIPTPKLRQAIYLSPCRVPC